MRAKSRLVSRQSRSFVEKKRMRSVFAASLFLLSLGIWSVFFYVFFNHRLLEIEVIDVNGTNSEISAKVRANVREGLQGKYFKLFSRSNALIYDHEDIEKRAASSSPKILSAIVEKKGLNDIIVNVTERTPEAVVCAGLPEFNDMDISASGENCYLSDRYGLVYEKSPEFQNDVYDRFYIESFGENNTEETLVGRYATSTDEFGRLKNVYRELEGAKIDVIAILARKNGEYEVYVRNPADTTAVPNGSPVVVNMNSFSSLSEQTANLVTFWVNTVRVAETKGNSLPLYYIDVRYKPNIFYR